VILNFVTAVFYAVSRRTSLKDFYPEIIVQVAQISFLLLLR